MVSADEVSAADQSVSSITIGGGDWDTGEGGVNGIAVDTTNAAIVVNGNGQRAASFLAVGGKVLVVGGAGSAPTSAPSGEHEQGENDDLVGRGAGAQASPAPALGGRALRGGE